MNTVKNILFVCGHNAGRSQMAEAYFNHVNTNAEYIAISCETHPTKQINPLVKKMLEQNDIPTHDLFPEMITNEYKNNAAKIFTMGCGVDCSIFSAEMQITGLGLSDPHQQNEETISIIFQEIQRIIHKIIASNI